MEAQNQPKRQLIQDHQDMLTKEITIISEMARALEERLNPVLRPPKPPPEGQDKAAGTTAGAALVSMLHACNLEVERTINRLKSIADRLEI